MLLHVRVCRCWVSFIAVIQNHILIAYSLVIGFCIHNLFNEGWPQVTRCLFPHFIWLHMDVHLHALKRRVKKCWPQKSNSFANRINKVRIKGDVKLAPIDECSLNQSYALAK